MPTNTKVSGILLLISAAIFLFVLATGNRSIASGVMFMAGIIGIIVVAMMMIVGMFFSIIAVIKEHTVWSFVFMGIYVLTAVIVGNNILLGSMWMKNTSNHEKSEEKRITELVKNYEKKSGKKVLYVLNPYAASFFLLDMAVVENEEIQTNGSEEIMLQYETSRIVAESIEMRIIEVGSYILVPDSGLYTRTRILKVETYKDGVYAGTTIPDDPNPLSAVEPADQTQKKLWEYYLEHKTELRTVEENMQKSDTDEILNMILDNEKR